MDYKDWINELEQEMNESITRQYDVELSFSLLTSIVGDVHRVIFTGSGPDGRPKEMIFDIDCTEHLSIFNMINTLIMNLESKRSKGK